jgi:hypothetical protein
VTLSFCVLLAYFQKSMGTKDKPSFTMRMTPEDEARIAFLVRVTEMKATDIVRQYLKKEAEERGLTPAALRRAAAELESVREAAANSSKTTAKKRTTKR